MEIDGKISKNISKSVLLFQMEITVFLYAFKGIFLGFEECTSYLYKGTPYEIF